MPRVRLTFAVSLVVLFLAGCGSSASPAPTPTVPAQAAAPKFQLAVASSQLAVGKQRFTFGVLKDNHPVEIPGVKTIFYWLHGNKGTAEQIMQSKFNYFAQGLAKTPQNSAADEIGGVYVAYPTFKHAGNWGVEAQLPAKYGAPALRAEFPVVQRLTIPAVGQPALRTNNPTVARMPATKLDSGRPPDDMHKLSIAGAIAQHKPLVLLFATAAFCQSRLCGPEIETIQGLENKYRGKVNFVHIEVYKNAVYQDGPAPAFTQWHLQTEPWVFVIDRRGIISAEFEGATPAGEIAPAIEKTLHPKA